MGNGDAFVGVLIIDGHPKTRDSQLELSEHTFIYIDDT